MKPDMSFFIITVIYILCNLLLLTTVVSTNDINSLRMKEIFNQLVSDNPTVVLLDDSESDLELQLRESLETVDNAGSVVFTFNPWWRAIKQRIKPRSGAAKTTPFRWTFVCLIEEKRTKNRVDKYLEELSYFGHGRIDRFMFIGSDVHISPYIKSLQVEKFQNVLGVPIDKNFIYQRQLYNRPERGKSKFALTTDLESVYWIKSFTASLNGQHFRISGTKFPPYLDWMYDEMGGKRLMGQNFRIFSEGSKRFNYTYELNAVETWKLTGEKLLNGTWDGVFGDLIYGKADIASVSTETVNRNGLADFVGPFGRAYLVFVTSPPENHLGKYGIFRSYTFDVWILIVAYFAIFVTLFYKALQYSVYKGTIKSSNGRLFSKALLLVWSLSFEQAEEKRPKGIRLLMIIWVAFMVIIGTGYRSNLAASISIPQPERKPKTFKQLGEQTNYHINFDLSGISAWNHFEENNSSMIKSIHKRSTPMENTAECVMKSFMDDNTVCIGWEFTLKLAAAKNLTIPQLNNPLTRSIEPVWAAWYTFALPKNSIFTDAFQTIGQTLFETGLTAYWRSVLLATYRSNSLLWTHHHMQTGMYKKLDGIRKSSKTETKPLKIENFQFVFIILFAGLFISLLGFLYEMWTARGANLCQKNYFYQGEPDSGKCRRITVTDSRIVPINFVR